MENLEKIKETKEQIKKYKTLKNTLASISQQFREADIYFSRFEFEDKVTFNTVGKILDVISFLLLLYDLYGEETRIKVREILGAIQAFAEKKGKEINKLQE